MSDNDNKTIFETPAAPADKAPAEAAPSTPSDSGIPTEAASLVGPGKKYATVEQALKALAHSQVHITTLETDNKELRDKFQNLESRANNVDAVLAEIKEGKANSPATPEVSPEAITERVLDTLSERNKEAKQKDNLQSSSDLLVEKFGNKEKAQVALADKAKELGLEVTDLMRLAAKSPAAFLAYFDTAPNQSSPNPVGGVNTDALNIANRKSAIEPGTFAWYQSQRKEKGDKWYFSPAIVKQRTDSATSMGAEKFFGRAK